LRLTGRLAKARPVGAGRELRGRAFARVDARAEDAGILRVVVEHGRATRADSAIGQREQRLLHALKPRVEPGDDERPIRVAVELRNLASAAPLKLVSNDADERRRPAP